MEYKPISSKLYLYKEFFFYQLVMDIRWADFGGKSEKRWMEGKAVDLEVGRKIAEIEEADNKIKQISLIW